MAIQWGRHSEIIPKQFKMLSIGTDCLKRKGFFFFFFSPFLSINFTAIGITRAVVVWSHIRGIVSSFLLLFLKVTCVWRKTKNWLLIHFYLVLAWFPHAVEIFIFFHNGKSFSDMQGWQQLKYALFNVLFFTI